MHPHEQVEVQRDVVAIQIPDGTRVPLAAGSPVTITQALGGTYTVMTAYGQLLRIDAKDADALGKEGAEADAAADEGGSLEDRVWAQMKQCYDPEIPVNIVDLGLVYDCRIEPGDGGGQRVDVKMTLTAPGCGMGDILAQDVKARIESLAGVEEAEVEIVFDPQWNPDMMTEAARLQLGFF